MKHKLEMQLLNGKMGKKQITQNTEREMANEKQKVIEAHTECNS